MKRIGLLLLVAASCQTIFAQSQSINELRRVFDCDVNSNRIAYVGHSSGAHWGAILSAVNRRLQTVVPTPLLFQFARFERYFNEAAMRRYGGAASQPKLVLWYDPQALSDRANWLQEYIGMGPIASILPGTPDARAPQFELKDLNGRTVRLGDYQGKVVLINFWATWCPPCRAEMPDLVRLQREYAKQGLQIIGITYPPERKDRVRRFARSVKVNYPIILGTREIKARFSSEETLPLTVVINRDGKVSDIISGILLREEFEEKIKPLLMKKMEGEIRDAKSDH